MIHAFFATPVGQAVVVLGLVSVGDFATGVFAAVRDDVFTFDAVAAWLRKTLIGRIAPIFGALFVGYLAGGLTIDDGVSGILSPGSLITGIGLVGATSYALEVISSIRESLVPKPAVVNGTPNPNAREVPEE